MQTAQGTQFYDPSCLYALRTPDGKYWNKERLDWIPAARNASLFEWEEVEKQGIIALRYTPYHELQMEIVKVPREGKRGH